MDHSLVGWDIGHFDAVEWAPWGSGGARAKIMATAGGFYLALIEAEAGYVGDRHEHEYPEFLYVVSGSLRTQGQELKAGDAYGANPHSHHTDFVSEAGATYISIFRI